jgi:predicted MPP superfamily phosphohydrolase
LLFVSVLAADLLRAAWEVGAWLLGHAPLEAAERLARARLEATLAAGVAGMALCAALWSGKRLVVKRVAVTLSRLPAALHGSTIVQLTDVHIGPTLGRSFLERVVDATNALEPDVVVITGDLVDGSVTRLAEAVAPLARLRARHGVFFVTGNHEYYSGAEPWCAYLTQLGLRVLRNERVRIGSGDESYDLAGIDDLSGRHFGPGQGADLPRALLGRDESRELVLLAHQPRMVAEAERAGVGLQISGHTHGGQIWPFHFLVRLQQPANSGLVRIGRALLYVSNGTGYWGPPMRLGSPAEITELTLQAALPSAE